MMWLLLVLVVIYCLFYFRRTSWYMDAAEMRTKGKMPAVDCVGKWQPCPAKCGENGIQSYKVISTAKDFGKDCPNVDGDTRGCKGECS